MPFLLCAGSKTLKKTQKPLCHSYWVLVLNIYKCQKSLCHLQLLCAGSTLAETNLKIFMPFLLCADFKNFLKTPKSSYCVLVLLHLRHLKPQKSMLPLSASSTSDGHLKTPKISMLFLLCAGSTTSKTLKTSMPFLLYYSSTSPEHLKTSKSLCHPFA